jgi:hypothetical protein
LAALDRGLAAPPASLAFAGVGGGSRFLCFCFGFSLSFSQQGQFFFKKKQYTSTL